MILWKLVALSIYLCQLSQRFFVVAAWYRDDRYFLHDYFLSWLTCSYLLWNSFLWNVYRGWRLTLR